MKSNRSLAKFCYKILIYIRQGQKACNLNTETSEMILGVPLILHLAEGPSEGICFRFPSLLIAFLHVENSHWQCLVAAGILFITPSF